MTKTFRRLAVVTGLAVTLTGSALAPAVVANADDGGAPTSRPHVVHVTGEQIPIPGTPHFTMIGDLVGTWYYYPRQPSLHDVPTLYSEAGTEVFVGCLDGNHDGDCNDRRDLRGQMRTVFLYWASFNTDRSGNRTTLIKGECVHPVTGGRGTFRGSRGVLDMVDRLDGDVVKTTYTGDIVLHAVPTEPPAPLTTAATPPSANSSAMGATDISGC
jgi:hypothetical protein